MDRLANVQKSLTMKEMESESQAMTVTDLRTRLGAMECELTTLRSHLQLQDTVIADLQKCLAATNTQLSVAREDCQQ